MKNTYGFIADSLFFGVKAYISVFSLLSVFLVALAFFSFFSWKTIIIVLSVLFAILCVLHWKFSKKIFDDMEDKRYSQYWGK